MKTELNNNYTIYFALNETRGVKTDKLVQDVKDLSIKFDLYDEVNYVASTPSKTSNSNEISLTYSIDISSPNSKKAQNIINFLEHIFKNMFDKYPAFVEPITL